MELTVMSGFTNNPPISHVCKPRDRNYHHGTTYATRHTCVTRTVTLNGLRHLLWLLLMWRSNLKKKKARRKRRAVYRQGCSICKVTDGQEEFGVFLGKKDAATLHLKFPPHLECRCMARHSSRRLHTGTQCSQCGTQTNPQVTAEASPPLT